MPFIEKALNNKYGILIFALFSNVAIIDKCSTSFVFIFMFGSEFLKGLYKGIQKSKEKLDEFSSWRNKKHKKIDTERRKYYRIEKNKTGRTVKAHFRKENITMREKNSNTERLKSLFLFLIQM